MLDCRIIKYREDFTVDITLRVAPGEALGIFGGSAAGKSTVLSCLAGTETADAGHIQWVAERWFPPPRPLHARRLGYLSQKERLFPHLTVRDNVLFSLDRHARAAARPWIRELCERLSLDALWDKPATTLSGGQARRAALARTLCRKPPLLLLDEPFTGLDRPLAREVMGALGDWQRRLGFTLLVVDHDPAVIRALCDSAVVVQQGHIVQSGAAGALRGEDEKQPRTD